MTGVPQGAEIVYSLPAGEDLSAHKYGFVKESAGTYVACSAVTDRPAGVLQNAPTAGQQAEVKVLGATYVRSGGAIAADALIGTDANGEAAAKTPGTDVTHYVAGKTQEAATGADQEIIAFVNCINPARAV
jgi:hypothetical protein